MAGDGRYRMTCGEAAVAVRMGLPPPIVVLDDEWLALIAIKHVKRKFGVCGTEVWRGVRARTPAHYQATVFD